MPTLVVTGASRGIGLEFARQYAADGWRVIAGVRNPDQADALRAVSGVEIRRLDVADPAGIEAFAAGLEGEVVDLLINNAGIMGPHPHQQSQVTLDTAGWEETLRVNALGPVLVTLALTPNLTRALRPVVATVSSQMGSMADNSSGGYYAYRMSKAAVNMGMKNLSLDLRDRNIAVVVLHPGWVQTDMGGDQAPVKPAESVAGLRRVLAGVGIGHSGRFYSYRGEELPW
ncbi:SDR family oxidoreductase [Rhodospirillum centenum]|uniref:C-factor protein n=1 Tax=Rhodospirillum centenum (strain ATCC 51521 / SW) TaxID=414684 RepID=B6IQU9_RHOCS|nr:SDR family oxidoreductase [Rhodospirillum centenum]ACI97835.1 C-factor protein [Rhodospirillum centenum SW]